MAYALVGSLGTVVNGSNPAFGQATTAGNLLVAWLVANASGTGTFTIASGTGWTLIFPNGANCFAYKENCGASETAPTFQQGGSAALFARLGEFSGGATSSPADQSGLNNGATSPQTATAGGADTALGELVLAINKTELSKAGTHASAVTLNNGATSLGAAQNDATSASIHYRMVYGITTGNSGADTAQGTSDSMNLSQIYMSLASFKLASTARVPRVPGVDSGFGYL